MIQNFLAILLKFGNTFLFVFLELICLYCIISFNTDQSAIWSNSSNIFVGSVYERYDKFTSFINLRDENNKLASQNADLMRQLAAKNGSSGEIDSLIASNFNYIPAILINNSINKLHNRITINKGSNDGVKKGMGIISSDGVIGIVVFATKKYSVVNSLLNTETKVSGLVKRTSTLGDLTWNGKNPRILAMNSVPQYVPIVEGDTIISSGFSTIFPRGQIIGFVDDIKDNTRTGYFDIEVKLRVDFASIKQVYVIKNIIYEDIQEFEKESEDE